MGCSGGGFKHVTLMSGSPFSSFETFAIIRVVVKGWHCLENTPGLIVWRGWLDRSQGRHISVEWQLFILSPYLKGVFVACNLLHDQPATSYCGRLIVNSIGEDLGGSGRGLFQSTNIDEYRSWQLWNTAWPKHQLTDNTMIVILMLVHRATYACQFVKQYHSAVSCALDVADFISNNFCTIRKQRRNLHRVLMYVSPTA
jgi:hypothetical protein